MQKPWAVNDFIVRDANSITGTGNFYNSRTIYSILTGLIGLPGVGAQYANRYGKWPIISGVNRPGSRGTLETHFLQSTSALRYAQRRSLLAELNPELEDLTRLMAADTLPPEGIVLALGPWDVYEKTAGTWHCRHLLWSDVDTVDIEGDITGAVHFEDGEQARQRAIVIEETTTNAEDNPSLETDAVGWSVAGATGSRSTTWAYRGQYSYKVVTDGAGTGELCQYTGNTPDGSSDYTVSIWINAPAGATLKLRYSDGVTSTDNDFTAAGGVERVQLTHTTAAVPAVGNTTVRTITSTQAITFYVDALQVEKKDHATTYCDGSLGPGYAWSGTPHASTSTRTATEFNLDNHVDLATDQDTLSLRVVVKSQYEYDGDWPVTINRIMELYEDANNLIRIYYDAGQLEIRAQIVSGGTTVTLSPGAQTVFGVGTWLDVVLTVDFSNNSYALYLWGSVLDTDTTSLSASDQLSEWNLGSSQAGGNHGNWFVADFFAWSRALSAAEVDAMYDGGASAGRARYLNVECESSPPLIIDGKPTDRGNTSALAVSKEVRWRSRDGDAHFWQPAGNSWTAYPTVDSDDEIYPEFRITPDTAKSAGNGYQYRRFVRIEWNASLGAVKYPILIGPIDTTGLVPAKMQADGDDWRVYVDGFEVERWFGGASGAAGGPNSATTKTWINLDFAPQEAVTLETSIGAAGTVSEVESEDDVSGFPNSGLLLIDSEIFYYTGKNDTDKKFTGVTRAVRNTSAAAHTGGTAAVEWIQHDVFIVYGNSTLSAPTVDDENEPAFALGSSTNGSWVYTEFGEDVKLRAAQWDWDIITQPSNERTEFDITTANNFTFADPWEEMGIDIAMYNGGPSGTPVVDKAGARWRIFNPCGLTNANFQNGNNFTSSDDGSQNKVYIQSSEDGSTWTDETQIAGNPWNINQALDANGADKWIGMIGTTELFQGLNADSDRGARIEVADVTLTVYASTAPSSTINAEESNYTLAATIENATTGESITLNFATMLLDETLVVNTYDKTITYLVDGSSQQQILTLDGGARRDWLRLLPGENELTYSDTGTSKVDIEILWHRRDWE